MQYINIFTYHIAIMSLISPKSSPSAPKYFPMHEQICIFVMAVLSQIQYVILYVYNSISMIHNHSPQRLKETLIMLKNLWANNQNEQAIKQAIWSLKYKLSPQYDTSILCFITKEENYQWIGTGIAKLGHIFKNLDCSNEINKKIHEFENYYKIQTQLKAQQLDIIRYNLGCLYEKQCMDIKAARIVAEGEKLTEYFGKLKAKLYLKCDSKVVNKIQPNSNEMKIIQKHERIRDIGNNLQYFKQLSKCSLNDIYNIGLCFKQNRRYKKSIIFFNKVVNELSSEERISALAQVNISECNFMLGKTKKAIEIINSLIQSENYYIQPYLKQFQAKIDLWTRSNEILEFGSLFGNQLIKQIKKEIQSGLSNQNQTQSSKCLLKSSKLLFLNEKNQQLARLLQGQKENQLKKLYNPFQVYKPKENLTFRGRKTLNSKTQVIPKSLAIRSIISPKQSPRHSPNQHKQIKHKVSRFESLNTLALAANLTNDLASRNTSKSNTSPFRSSSSSSSSSNYSSDKKLIEDNKMQHYWTIIKNSTDQNQIAEKYLNLGDIYSNQNDHDKALTMYKQALIKGRYEAYGRIGHIYYSKGKSAAIQYFQKYLKHVDGQQKDIQLKLLHCYSKNQQYYKKAYERLKQILDGNPCNKEAHLLYVTILMKQGHFQRAISFCQDYRKKNYKCYENHHILGLFYKLTSRTKQAFDSFITALRMNPTHTLSLVQLTQLTQFSHFYPELIEIYKKVLHSNPKNYEILQILRYLVSKKPVYHNQIKQILSFSELIAYGDYFMEKQMIEQAQYAYKEAGQYTSNTLLKQKLGNLQYFKKNYAQAEKYFKQSQKRKPAFKIQVKLGHALLKQNKFKEAQIIFQECILKQKQNKSIYLNMLGQCQFGLGNYEKAMKKFEQSSSLGYNKKVNFYWENLCRKKIIQSMKKQRQTKP